MIIADKLYKLRTKSGLSQEELAEKMNVSRQSVSKWESGNSIPAMDKIVELSKIYGVSTDYLLLEEIEEMPEEIVPDLYEGEGLREVTLDEANRFISLMKDSAKQTAMGVFLCVICAAPLLLLLGLAEGGILFRNLGIDRAEDIAAGIGISILLLVVAAAVMMFIVNGKRTEDYEFLEKEEFKLEYGVKGIVEKADQEYRSSYYKGMSIGVALCVIAAIPLIIATIILDTDLVALSMTSLLLCFVACGVYLIVQVSCVKGGFDKLLMRGDYTEENKRKEKDLGLFDEIYWCIVTALYFLISFLTMKWEITWVVWPVAGALFGAVRSAIWLAVKGR